MDRLGLATTDKDYRQRRGARKSVHRAPRWTPQLRQLSPDDSAQPDDERVRGIGHRPAERVVGAVGPYHVPRGVQDVADHAADDPEQAGGTHQEEEAVPGTGE